MKGGAPSGMTIMIVKNLVVAQLNQVVRLSFEDHDDPWKAFYAGAMNQFNRELDVELSAFGVEVKDE